VDGLARLGGAIDFWNPRHEQAAAYMADGYARASADIGTCMVVPGPGLLNAAAGLATAYACSSRVLMISGQLPSAGIGKGLGFLHEIPDQSGILSSLTKWSARARSAAEIPGLVRQAVHELRSGRPRPVGLEVPPDVLSAVAPVSFVQPPADDARPVQPDADAIVRAVAAVRAAACPVIYAGGGVVAGNASRALQALAERLGAPVVMTRNGRGAMSDDHPLAIGPLGAPSLLSASDLVLVVGSRFVGGNGIPPATPPGASVVLINAEAADLREPRAATISVLGDARLALEAMMAELGPGRPDSSRAGEVASVRRTIADELAYLEPQMSFVRAIRDAIPADGFLVNELTQVGYVAGLAYPVLTAGTFITPGYQGTLGYGFPTALGVKAACPDRAVVSVTGDGGFGWNLQELATARRYDLGVAVVVFNDGAFGNVRRTQQESFDGRYLGTGLTNPDFLKLADAFGIAGTRVSTPDALGSALRQALAGKQPVLIEVPLGECPSPWKLIHQRAHSATQPATPPATQPGR
jgi:acetolactate synthase I/II/III large subunit